MRLLVSLLLVILTGVDHVYPRITLSSNVTNVTGEVCPQRIQFACNASDFETTLIWGFNSLGAISFHYVLDAMNTFPLNVFEDENVTVVILSAVRNPQNMDRANFTSTLTVSLSYLINVSVQRIVCGTPLENDIYDLSLDDVTVRAPPPRPVFTCSLANDGGSATFNWNNTYSTNYSVNHYRLESTVCSANDISPTEPYVCDGLQIGEVYSIILEAVNCDVQQGAAENVIIDLQGEPEPPRNVEVVSLFNSSVLTQVTVKWTVNGSGDRISNRCDHKPTTYIVSLQNDLNPSIEREIDLESCEDSICSIDISISDPNGTYSVSIRPNSILGTNSVMMYHSMIPANATSLLRTSFDFSNCITYVTCSSDLLEEGSCGISYSSKSDSGSVVGMLNNRHALPVLTASTEYQFATNLIVNLSLTINVQASFTTGEFDPRLTSSNIGMIAVGILLIITAIGLAIVSIVLLGGCIPNLGKQYNFLKKVAVDAHRDEEGGKGEHTRNPEKYLSWVICVSSLATIILTLVLWISFGAVVENQKNTCEVSWQTSRDNLAATSLFFSIISLLISAGAITFVWRRWDEKVWNFFKRNAPTSLSVNFQVSDNPAHTSGADQSKDSSEPLTTQRKDSDSKDKADECQPLVDQPPESFIEKLSGAAVNIAKHLKGQPTNSDDKVKTEGMQEHIQDDINPAIKDSLQEETPTDKADECQPLVDQPRESFIKILGDTAVNFAEHLKDKIESINEKTEDEDESDQNSNPEPKNTDEIESIYENTEAEDESNQNPSKNADQSSNAENRGQENNLDSADRLQEDLSRIEQALSESEQDIHDSQMETPKQTDNTEEHNMIAQSNDGVQQEEPLWRRLTDSLGVGYKIVKDTLGTFNENTEEEEEESNQNLNSELKNTEQEIVTTSKVNEANNGSTRTPTIEDVD